MLPATDLVDPAAAVAAGQERPPESRDRTVWTDARHGFYLIGRYFAADRWVGGTLLAVRMAINAARSYAMMRATILAASITNMLATRSAAGLGQALGGVALAMGFIVSGIIIENLVSYALRIRARGVLNARLLSRWLGNDRFYHLERRFAIDHPEQRIQDDVPQFIENALEVGISVIGALFPIYLYVGQLWRLSPPIRLDALGIDGVLNGFLFWTVLVFTLVWTTITHLLGRRLTRAEIVRQQLEAQFRQELGNIRENGEAIAFEKGAAIERARVDGTFALIRHNWRFFTWAHIRIDVATIIPSLIFVIAPLVLCAPFVLDGRMTVGDVGVVGTSAMLVYTSVGVLIINYARLAILRSAAARLRRFDELLHTDQSSDIVVATEGARDIAIRDLAIAYPDGTPMLRVGDLTLRPGSRVLVRGPSGVGKSTLLRTLAGLWPYGSGQIDLPHGARIAFLPQRSYMPDATLAGLIAYPRAANAFPDETYVALLDRLGLSALTPRLHLHQAWRRSLSPGEQQRIAAARAILAAPDFLFMDEATSALDLHSEANLYALLVERLPHVALISVAHRTTLQSYHDEAITIANGLAIRSPLPCREDAGAAHDDGDADVVD